MVWKWGKIISKGKDYIFLESNYNGYCVFVSNVEEFEVNKIDKVFVYEYRTDYTSSLYGFKKFKERMLFEDLLSISGIGPKTAQNILKNKFDIIINAIVNGNVEFLHNTPFLGIKSSKQIILELQDKYKKIFGNKKEFRNSSSIEELKKSLKMLGFESSQIANAINSLKNFSLPIEELVSQSIKLISNARNQT